MNSLDLPIQHPYFMFLLSIKTELYSIFFSITLNHLSFIALLQFSDFLSTSSFLSSTRAMSFADSMAHGTSSVMSSPISSIRELKRYGLREDPLVKAHFHCEPFDCSYTGSHPCLWILKHILDHSHVIFCHSSHSHVLPILLSSYTIMCLFQIIED